MVLTILISFVLQTTVFQYFNFGGIAPNLLIIVTASYGKITILKRTSLEALFPAASPKHLTR